MKVFVINLDSRRDRLRIFCDVYSKSSLMRYPLLERHDAIDGKSLDLSLVLSPEYKKRVDNIERIGYREYHSECTRGGVGCYLSHITLYEKLILDTEDMYLILEDDTNPNIDIKKIDLLLKKIPKDWDIALLGHYDIFYGSRENGDIIYQEDPINWNDDIYDNEIRTINHFWGFYAYIINKKGAQILIDDYKKNGILMQIDSRASLLSMNKKLNIYGSRLFEVPYHIGEIGCTDIQYMDVKKIDGIYPFELK